MEGVGRLKRLDEFTLADLEAVRLILRGDSVIDWHRLNFEDDEEAASSSRAGVPSRRARRSRAGMNAIKAEAISYLRRHFEYPIPKPVEQAVDRGALLARLGQGAPPDVRLHAS